MTDKITYKVGDKEFYPDSPELTAGKILSDAGYDPHVFRLEAPQNGTQYESDDIIAIKNGDEFTVSQNLDTPQPKELHFKVDDKEFTTDKNALKAADILQMAGFDSKKYFLSEISGEKTYKAPDELVEITDGKEFVALLSGPTPVSR